jgi:putative restriction endonuclease
MKSTSGVPSPTTGFAALAPGEPFLFKLHAPRNAIAGGAFFSKYLHLPVSLAWDAFKAANGTFSEAEVSRLLVRLLEGQLSEELELD